MDVLLSKDSWSVKVEIDQISENKLKTKPLRIEGHNKGNPKAKLNAKHFIDIIELGKRESYKAFVFCDIDFSLFRGLSFIESLPVKTVYFEQCESVGALLCQILGNGSSDHGNQVNSVSFFNCKMDTISLKESILTYLKYNYHFQSIDFIDSNKSLRNVETVSGLNKKINYFLRRNFVYRSICKEVIVILLGIKKFRKGTVVNSQPRDVLLIISKLLLKRINEYCHVLYISERLNRVHIDSAYDKYIEGNDKINHQHSLTLIYNECNPKCLDPLINLKNRRTNLNWLVISDTEYLNGAITDMRISFIPKIFELLIYTKTKILTINNIDFNDRFLKESNVENETLNGNDDVIDGLRGHNFPAFSLKEIHLVYCTNLRNFLYFFLRLFTKTKKTKTGGTTLITKFGHSKIDLSSFVCDKIYSVSIFINEQTNFIDIKVLE
jgi:hypothetical protein